MISHTTNIDLLSIENQFKLNKKEDKIISNIKFYFLSRRKYQIAEKQKLTDQEC